MDKPTTRKGRRPAAKKRSTSIPKTRKKTATSSARSTRQTTTAIRKKPAAAINLNAPEFYLNRELTWLEFNRRVLHMAADKATPLLERVKFLAIVSANLDEFFMKRVGGLKQQIAAGIRTPSVDGRTPAEQLKESHVIVRETHREQNRVYRQLHTLLEAQGIRLSRYTELEPGEQNLLRDEFISNIFPLLTPLAMDPGHPFPFISNLALNMLVSLRYPGGSAIHYARVKVPMVKGIAPRFLHVNGSDTYVRLEDVVSNNLDLLFPGMEIISCELFRVTRNAVVEVEEEEADDLLAMIESELRDRHFAPIVRLQVENNMNPTHRGMLAAELGLDEAADVFGVESMMAMRDLFAIAGLDFPELHDTPHKPVDHTRLVHDSRNIFHIIRERGAMLLQHPYESFSTSVERFLRTASEDPKVLAIKMTLYRTSEDSAIVESLVNASRNGKQVAVLVELKARFDEAANIRWARRMEQAGIHVTYGVVGLKTHSKVILVVRKDYNGLRRYVHVGTGNYHAGTAHLYCDLGMLTCDEAIASDLTELFNYLTGYSPPPRYRKILTSPYTLKKTLLEKIDREIKNHSAAKPGLIQFKMNALEDVDITRGLYRAAQAGVKVDLIVRDTCRLRPGLAGLTESAQVISVIGRFLEHARIYYFHNNGDEEYFIGSADLMKRNLESRVEVVAPVEDAKLRQELRLIIDVQLSSRKHVWEMQPDGSYIERKDTSSKKSLSPQETFIQLAQKRMAAASKHQQAKLRKKLLNHFHNRLKQNQ
ncbi:MAG: polyphosphate kinase 1 [Gammaproteobacteria bacterium]|nr:polyphosphate kinase 1 [Gammaproteobacteria bacterium]MDH3887438.1 polyphosphate kinase 1 [Gammaproteobacteria bacterium]